MDILTPLEPFWLKDEKLGILTKSTTFFLEGYASQIFLILGIILFCVSSNIWNIYDSLYTSNQGSTAIILRSGYAKITFCGFTTKNQNCAGGLVRNPIKNHISSWASFIYILHWKSLNLYTHKCNLGILWTCRSLSNKGLLTVTYLQ